MGVLARPLPARVGPRLGGGWVGGGPKGPESRGPKISRRLVKLQTEKGLIRPIRFNLQLRPSSHHLRSARVSQGSCLTSRTNPGNRAHRPSPCIGGALKRRYGVVRARPGGSLPCWVPCECALCGPERLGQAGKALRQRPSSSSPLKYFLFESRRPLKLCQVIHMTTL